jgi:hypothetical protein
MRGTDEQQELMFSYISAKKRVPKDYPLKACRMLLRKPKTLIEQECP